MITRRRRRLIFSGCVVLLLLGILFLKLPTIGAALILHPVKRPVAQPPPNGCHEVTFQGNQVKLQGWRGNSTQQRRGTLIYLHGVSDNRESSAGVLTHFRECGFDVIAYDSRAHGGSEGTNTTYGYWEKEDLRRILDTLPPGPVVLVGSSLGGAVALQTAAFHERITAVVAAETFSDLRTVITERAPAFFTTPTINSAINLAEQKGNFQVDAVSPMLAAQSISVPVLLIHGESDTETPPDHSRRIFAALKGQKQLLLVPGAGHNQSLQGDTWQKIEEWIDNIIDPESI